MPQTIQVDSDQSGPQVSPEIFAKALLDLAVHQAVCDHPKDGAAATAALRASITDDPDLMRLLFEQHYFRYWKDVLAGLIHREMRQKQRVQVEAYTRAMPSPRDTSDDDRVRASDRFRDAQHGLTAVNDAATKALLDTFIINGKPIGDVTPIEAASWAASRERDARFVRMLIGGVPENDPIRRWVTQEEAERLYKMAEAGE